MREDGWPTKYGGVILESHPSVRVAHSVYHGNNPQLDGQGTQTGCTDHWLGVADVIRTFAESEPSVVCPAFDPGFWRLTG